MVYLGSVINRSAQITHLPTYLPGCLTTYLPTWIPTYLDIYCVIIIVYHHNYSDTHTNRFISFVNMANIHSGFVCAFQLTVLGSNNEYTTFGLLNLIRTFFDLSQINERGRSWTKNG